MQFFGDKTQILDSDTAVNATTVVYTVPAGKVFHLISSKTISDGGAAGIVHAAIRNDSDVEQFRIGQRVAAGSDDFEPGFAPALPEGWDIAVVSDTALLTGQLDIFGLEVNA